MEKIESIYDLIIRTKFEYYLSDVVKDIRIIEFAILSMNVEYKTKIYNKMLDKYAYELDKVGFGKAMEITAGYYSFGNLPEESIVRNSLSILRRWIIRCSGYMCVRKLAEYSIDDGVDGYMKRYTVGEEVADIYTLQDKLETIDDEILTCLRNSI